MKIITLSLMLLFIAMTGTAMSPEQSSATSCKKILVRQIGWGALGTATLCLTPALAASSGFLFIFEAAEASKGGRKSLASTVTSLAFTAASAGTSIYSFWRIHKLQQLKKVYSK